MDLGSREFSRWCFDHAVRIGGIIAVGCSHDGEACAEPLEELIDDNSFKDLARVFCSPGLPKAMVERLDGEGDFSDESERRCAILQYLMDHEIWGYVVKVERCTRHYSSGKSFTFSWNDYSTQLFYTVALDIPFVSHLRHRIEADEKKEKSRASTAEAVR